ncbi:PREDICTED: protein AIR1 [Tarenaya hassleriana]|uniref:protein AIR1 n=1 Tax=Tarenaya hassleriana TaxID=28532 RepID=UPI00053C4A6E|nr:PREDICTED: protein AIR1 [Tarenaya hassleriana]
MPRRDDERFVFDAGDDEDNQVEVVRAEDDEDDDEANEDLSLKILEKALSRRAVERSRNELGFDDSNETSMADLCVSASGVVGSVLVNGEKPMEENVQSNRKKKKKKMEIKSAQETSIVTKDEDGVEIVEEVSKDEDAEVDKFIEPNAGETSNNMVLRKLLRGPRYFDAPDGGWESCFNCGEQGHMTINCPSLTKRKKPCFVCGSLEHGVKQCAKAQDCYICKQSGHRAKDCPEKYKSVSKNTNICLRCGYSGHDLFSCKYEYSHDDLKDIQCYVCKAFGHLCCVDPSNSPTWAVSCYRCGQLGHTGLACGRLNDGSMGRDSSPSSCFKCGERGHFARECLNSLSLNFSQGKELLASSCYRCGGMGHFARECPNSTPVFKRRHDASSPSHKKSHKKSKEKKEYHSAPHEPNGKTKRKKTRDVEGDFTTPRKAKHRGGWTTMDPEEEDSSRRKRKSRRPSPPSTPCGKNHRISSGGWPPSSPSSWRQSSSHHHRYVAAASRFSDRRHYHGEYRGNYDEW